MKYAFFPKLFTRRRRFKAQSGTKLYSAIEKLPQQTDLVKMCVYFILECEINFIWPNFDFFFFFLANFFCVF
jgi:hypothetical protein